MPMRAMRSRHCGRSRTADCASAMSAMMPPSPRLSARMISTTYLRETTIMSAQNIVDRPPRMLASLRAMPCCGENVSFTAYSGLVPMSPKTMPRAERVSAAVDDRCGTRFTNFSFGPNGTSSALLVARARKQRAVHARLDRLAVEEALALVARKPSQKPHLRIGLDALCHDLQAQAVAERDDGLGEHALVGTRAGADVAHEGAVDLQLVDRQVPEIREARVAGAEVVHRERHPERLQALQRGDGGVDVVHHRALGELHLEVVRV